MSRVPRRVSTPSVRMIHSPVRIEMRKSQMRRSGWAWWCPPAGSRPSRTSTPCSTWPTESTWPGTCDVISSRLTVVVIAMPLSDGDGREELGEPHEQVRHHQEADDDEHRAG